MIAPVDQAIAGILAMQSPVSQPAQPFTWGAGGARISPEDLARRRAIADQQTQGDYSPVGHWTQGLGRVLDGFTGGLEERKLDRAEAANQAASAQEIAALAGEGNADLVPGLSSADPVARTLAAQMFKSRMPVAPELSTDEKLIRAAGYAPGTPEYQAQAQALIDNKGNPFITATLPGGGFYGGPQSGFMTALTGGGGQASGPAMPEWWNTLTPEEQGVIQRQGEGRMRGGSVPQGSPLSGGPRAGDVVDGYRFRGGNPNNQSSWEQVR